MAVCGHQSGYNHHQATTIAERKKGGEWKLVSLKTDNKSRRTLNPAPVVMDTLRHQKAVQAQAKLSMGCDYANPMNLVFTHENGQHLTGSGVYKALKTIVRRIGLDIAVPLQNGLM